MTQKVSMFTKLSTVVANIRGINPLGEKQQSAKQWEQVKVDVALLNETHKIPEASNKEHSGETLCDSTAQESVQNSEKHKKTKTEAKGAAIRKLTEEQKQTGTNADGNN